MLILITMSLWLRIKNRLYSSTWFLRICQFTTPLGFFAVLAGWVTTEVGRQPWTVYGLLRTANSVTPSLSGRDVLLSLIGYMAVYFIIFPVGAFLMIRIIRKGFVGTEGSQSPIEGGQHASPIIITEDLS